MMMITIINNNKGLLLRSILVALLVHLLSQPACCSARTIAKREAENEVEGTTKIIEITSTDSGSASTTGRPIQERGAKFSTVKKDLTEQSDLGEDGGTSRSGSAEGETKKSVTTIIESSEPVDSDGAARSDETVSTAGEEFLSEKNEESQPRVDSKPEVGQISVPSEESRSVLGVEVEGSSRAASIGASTSSKPKPFYRPLWEFPIKKPAGGTTSSTRSPATRVEESEKPASSTTSKPSGLTSAKPPITKPILTITVPNPDKPSPAAPTSKEPAAPGASSAEPSTTAPPKKSGEPTAIAISTVTGAVQTTARPASNTQQGAATAKPAASTTSKPAASTTGKPATDKPGASTTAKPSAASTTGKPVASTTAKPAAGSTGAPTSAKPMAATTAKPGQTAKEDTAAVSSTPKPGAGSAVTAKSAGSTTTAKLPTTPATGSTTTKPAGSITGKPAAASTTGKPAAGSTTAAPASPSTAKPASLATTAKPAGSATTAKPATAITGSTTSKSAAASQRSTTAKPADSVSTPKANATTVKPASPSTERVDSATTGNPTASSTGAPTTAKPAARPTTGKPADPKTTAKPVAGPPTTGKHAAGTTKSPGAHVTKGSEALAAGDCYQKPATKKPGSCDCLQGVEDDDKVVAVVLTKRGGFKGRKINSRAVAKIMHGKVDETQMVDIKAVKPISVSSDNSYVFPAGHYYFPHPIRFAGFVSP